MRKVRDIVIDDAIRDRKIAASRRAEYERLWAADPRGTGRLLTAPIEEGGLAPGIVPIEAASTRTDDSYDTRFLTPAERAHVEAARSGSTASAPRTPEPVPVAVAAAGDDAYPDGWLSGPERHRISAVKDGTFRHPVVAGDGPGGTAARRGE